MKKELANRLSSMTPEEIRNLLKRTLKKKSDKTSDDLKMKRNEREEYPLSNTQERTWFLCQLNPDSSINNNAFAIRIKTLSSSDPEIFEKALKLLANRHEILRTSFHSRDGQPYQKIHKSVDFKVDYLDLRHLSNKKKEKAIIEEAVKEGHKLFNLSKLPLINFKILHIDENEYVYLITPHHIISDGWSNAIFSRELIEIYISLENNTPYKLPEVKYQYVDYVHWEKNWLKSKKFHEYMDFWKNQLENIVTFEFPCDYPRPKIMTTKGGLESIVLDNNLVNQLTTFSKKRAINLFSTLLSIFNILLYKYSGQNDIIIGTPMANHNKREFQNVMGMFLNTLPIRSIINKNLSFLEYLNQIKDLANSAFLHQEMPFDKLIDELKPVRDLSKHPLFQIMFVYQNIPSLYKIKDKVLIPLKIDYHLSKFDIDLWIEEADDKMIISCKYFTDIFKKSTIRRFLEHLQILMKECVVNPNKKIIDLEYVSDVEKRFLLSNKSERDFKTYNKTFIDFFEEQVELNPKNIALQYLNKKLTYEELNLKVNSLANYLLENDVAKGDIVALLTKRSEKSIVSMLAILKIGAAYLPIESSTPIERLSYIINDSNPKIILSEKKFANSFDKFDIKTIFLDEDFEKIEKVEKNNPNIKIQPSDLAYVIYTSGTTGMPKGVCIEHKQLLNYTLAIREKMELEPGSSFATVSSLAADLGNTMIFPALSIGDLINIIDDDYLTNAELFAKYMDNNKIDCIKLTPSHLNSLLGSHNAVSILPKKLLILGGETLSWQLIDRIRNIKPDLRIMNHYGPTEATTGVLTYEIPINDYKKKEQLTVPIGSPLANTQIYILDSNKKIVTFGIKGEIYIGGENLTRGYLNNSKLTDKYFIQSPFDNNKKLYKTGDFAKYLDDKNILFLGRKDKQVKIRGYRVELEGIENIICKHEDIMQAVLLKKNGRNEIEQLIAFIKLKENSELNQNILKDYLKKFIPSYMIPDSFVFLDDIPITKNGKIDFNKLRELTEQKPIAKKEFQAPRDNIELVITNIWKDILNLNRIGIDDNFFEIGGQSLIAVKLFSEINKNFAIDLPLAVLFENGTIKDLAKIIRSEKKFESKTPLVTIQKSNENTPIFLVHPAGGNVLSYYELSQNLGNSYSVYGLQSTSALNWNSSDFSIGKMAKYYLDEILSKSFNPPFVFGGWSMGALVAFEMAILCQKQNISLPLVIVIDQLAPEINSPNDFRQIDEATRLSIFADKVGHLIGNKLDLPKEKLTNITTEEQSELFLNEFKKYNLVPQDINADEFGGFLELMIRHNEITLQYNPELYKGKVLIVKAENSFPIDSPLLDISGLDKVREKDLGWQKYVLNPLDVIDVPGDHISMMAKPNIEILSKKLKEKINFIN